MTLKGIRRPFIQEDKDLLRQETMANLELLRKRERDRVKRKKKENVDDTLERSILRIDGLEMYALVMATIAGFSFSAMESVTREELNNVGFIWRLGFGVSVCTATLLSLYSTVIFALSSLYAKTALGMRRDIEYSAFLERTKDLRLYGFYAFVSGCASFSLCFLILIHVKIEGFSAIFTGTLGVVLFYFGWKHTSDLVNAAKPIFVQRKSKLEDISIPTSPPKKWSSAPPFSLQTSMKKIAERGLVEKKESLSSVDSISDFDSDVSDEPMENPQIERSSSLTF